MSRRFVRPASLLVAAAILLGWGSASTPLFDPDEARFARTSVEMVDSGDWVVPTFQGVPRLVKPPLIHWLQSSIFRLVGPSAWSARLHALLATLVTLTLTMQVARRRSGAGAGIWAGAVLITMPLVFALGRLGTIDALLAGHVAAILAIELQPTSVPRGAWVVGALGGLAFLAKGPVGLALPAIAILAGRTAVGRRLLPTWPQAGAACLAGLATIAVWVVPLFLRIGGGEAGDTLRREVFDRVVAGTAHVEPWWYYAAALALALLPWSAVILCGLVRGLGGRRDEVGGLQRFAAAGAVAGVVLLSLSQGKLVTYALPLAPLFGWVAVGEMNVQLRRPQAHRRSSGLLLATLWLFAAGLTVVATDDGEPGRRMAATLAAGGFGVAAVVGTVAWSRRRLQGLYAAALAATGLLYLAVVGLLLPELASRRSSLPLIRSISGIQQAPVVTVEMKVPSLAFYLDRPIEEVAMSQLSQRLDRDDQPVYVLDEGEVERLPAVLRSRLRQLGHAGKYVAFTETEESTVLP